jgi:hypothetical protein
MRAYTVYSLVWTSRNYFAVIVPAVCSNKVGVKMHGFSRFCNFYFIYTKTKTPTKMVKVAALGR